MPPRRLGPRAQSALSDLRSALAEYGTAPSEPADVPSSAERPRNQGVGRRPGESTDDYLFRVMFGGDAPEREEAQRSRAGLPGTAAGYGTTGDYVSPWSYPDSSRVKAYQWDEGLQQLRVRFIKYNTPWVYENVDLAVFQQFDAATSKGKFINSVMNSFPYRHASPDEEDSFFSGV